MEDSIPAAELLALFGNARRRRAVELLDDRGQTALEDLAVAVVARERKNSVGGVDEDARNGGVDEDAVERVAVELHHNHLPRLDDAGVIDYDSDENRVVRVEREDAEKLRTIVGLDAAT